MAETEEVSRHRVLQRGAIFALATPLGLTVLQARGGGGDEDEGNEDGIGEGEEDDEEGLGQGEEDDE